MPQDVSFTGSVPVRMALALLASLRDLDTPDDPEELAESDLPLNLRRRLGLSSVIGDQIRRYEQLKGDVSAREVASLFELIGRRPDAAEVFADAGRRIARQDLADRRLAPKLAIGLMPTSFRRRRAWDRARKIARRLSPASVVRVEYKRGALVVERGLMANAVAGGVGCAVLEGAIQGIFREYRAGDAEVLHTCCEGLDGEHCAWELGISSDLASAADAAPATETLSAETNGATPGA